MKPAKWLLISCKFKANLNIFVRILDYRFEKKQYQHIANEDERNTVINHMNIFCSKINYMYMGL